MAANRLRSALSIFALTALVAASAYHEQIMAQVSAVTINKIEQPFTEGDIALADPHAGAVTVPSAPDAWGGPRTGNEATLSDRVVNYEIDATLDPVRHTVEGKQKLTWRNRSNVEVRSVYLHLYMNAFESSNSTFFTEARHNQMGFRSDVGTKEGEWGHIELRKVSQGGAKVSWSFVHPDNGPETDHTVVRFDLPVPVAAGASTVLDIDFLTQLPRVVARTGYFGSFHLVAQWFPKIGVLELPGERGATAPRWNVHEHHQQSEFYADFGNYDIRITAPKDYTVGATGELQGAPVEKDGKLTHHYVQGDVHDFAWTADNRTAKPIKDTWSGPGSAQVAITVLYPPEMKASADTALVAAKDSLAYFSRTLGPYPYKTLTIVVPPHNAAEAGGMEYPTFFTVEGNTHTDEGTLDKYMTEFVTIHEFGHGYFYGILASNEQEEPMLDEGLNEYWNHRMLRERKQDIHVSTRFMKAIGITPTVKGFDLERTASPREEPADPLGQNAYDRLQGVGPVYVRTATMMRDLEERVGKENMERAFKEYYRRWKFRHPSTADLRETLAEVTGQREAVEQVFAQQVYATGKVDDRVDRFSSEEVLPQVGTEQVQGKWVELNKEAVEKRIDAERKAWEKANPKAKEGTGPFPFRTSVTLRRRGVPVPQTILVKFADGTSETVKWDNQERWARFSWVRPAKAVSVELDPQRMHYLDVSKLDDSRTLKANSDASRRWTGDLSAFVSILLSLIANV
ncbi:M1 family metallopeptidase [Massilia sp. PAMC28688]|uniref:M1 family metallopeptidase n=1 Tax=Massilia sp. PAMC28688 TaxID=2861283 RepID=UPI001C63782F|nr:M1 family metallopeptidase [Massilia sp. PAMC28688]QYF94043.1 M1 family metallopeptidase [Massilia sp. PAMC28688]